MAFNIDIDRLLQLVEERPTIWDRSAEGYRMPRLTRAAWQEIYCEIFDGFHKLDDKQKQEVGKYSFTFGMAQSSNIGIKC